MKKKLLECDIHGPTLFRCKRKYWKKGGKDQSYADEYTERCVKCISEGKHKKNIKPILKKKKHVKIR